MMDLGKIKMLFKLYSAKDIAITLFIMDMWLPNISSLLKINCLYASFLSIKSGDFSQENLIIDYKSFCELGKLLVEFSPDFPSLEDFVPVPDRGEVKVTINDKNYNLLYGGEVDNIYDRVESYKVIYDGLDIDFKTGTPMDDLIGSLEYHTYLIDNLPSCCTSIGHITPGHFEIPSEDFFSACQKFLSTNFLGSTKRGYISQLGEIAYDSSNAVINDVFEDKFLDKLFLEVGGEFFPIMPRRFITVLIQHWGKYLKTMISNKDVAEKIDQNIALNCYRFLKERFQANDLIGINQCLDQSTNKLIGATFFGAIFSKKKTILFYNMPISYFQNKGKTLQEQKELLSQSISSMSPKCILGDCLDKKCIEIKNTNKEDIIFIGLLPSFALNNFVMSNPSDYTGHIRCLLDFVTIIDEIIDNNILGEYLEWEKEKKSSIISSMIDSFIAFKNMNTVPVEGAIEPDIISLDHTIGNNHRYEELTKFRSHFPDNNPLGINPRSWKLEVNHGMTVIISKTYHGIFLLIIKIGKVSVSINSPVNNEDLPPEEQLKCYETVLQCIGYYLQKNADELGKMKFFNKEGTLQISIFCRQYIQDKKQYNHVGHLISDKYKIDNGKLKSGHSYGLRLVFDKNYCMEQFKKNTNEGELELFWEILGGIKGLAQENIPSELEKKLSSLIGQKPGFKIHIINRIPFSFPGYVDPMIPETKHFLKAKKEISKLLQEKGVIPGTFSLEVGKNLLNDIKNHLVGYINTVAERFSLEGNLLFLISRFDALIYKNRLNNQQFLSANERLTDYDPVEVFSGEERKFLDHIKNYRYCMEKFIQLNSHGTSILTREDFQFFIALIDWLLVFQQASDVLHYGLFTTGITIKSDFSFDVAYSDDIDSLGKDFSEFENKIRIGEIGDNALKIKIEDIETEDLLEQIDKSFIKDLGFSFDNMMKILQILCTWGYFMGKSEYDEYNKETPDTIFNESTKEEKWIDRGEFDRIIDFLTIKSDDILKTYNPEDKKIYSHPDIPVWERSKRFNRYNIKPLVNIDGTIYWGAINAKKTMDVWSHDIQTGRLPIIYNLDNTLEIIQNYKSLLDYKLESYAFEKIKEKFPNATDKNFEFIKRDPKADPKHSDVGDYDVICYDNIKNILRLFECKEILPPYSFKDSGRVRRLIFEEYLPKIIKREEYMKKNIDKLNELNKWTIASNVTIKSIYVSSYNYWRTQYPIHKTNVEFISLKLLYDKISGKL